MFTPNILYIHSHDTGRYIQPYGHAVATPRLQGLAEEGTLFRQAFTANPTCSPSRACLLTGQSAHSNGMLGLAHRGFSMCDYGRHIVNTLRPHGYISALAGIQHIANMFPEPWKTIGYDQCLGGPKTAHADAAAFLDSKPDKPFFLSVGFFETHRKFPSEHPDEDPRYSLPPSPLPDTPETRLDMARFKQMARTLDQKVGFVLDALERNGLADNTLVICTTDHGIAFPRMKCNLHDSGTGVMLIMRGPGGFNGGKVIDSMVSQIDIFPTVCELLGVAKPDWLEGGSFLPLVNGDTANEREEVFSEVNYHAAFEPMRAVRTKRWKYIRRYDPRPAPVLPNCDASHSKDVWLQNGWNGMPPEEEALYDLAFDPNESRNLVDDPQYAQALEETRGRLRRWMEETNDFLLDGDVPLPETATLNSRDELDPTPQNTMPPGTR